MDTLFPATLGAARRCGIGSGPMISHGTTQQSSAPYNRRMVLDVIRRQGAISRRDIVDFVSLSPQTVANITNDLEAIGLVVAKRLTRSKSRGQPPIVFELNPEAGCSIGITIEPRRMSAALVDQVGTILGRCAACVDSHDPRQALAAMVGLIRELLREPGTAHRAWGVGIALPGTLSRTDPGFPGPAALLGWPDLSVLDELRKATQLQVYYSADCVAGALGETLYGVAKPLDNFFYLHLGVGIGGTLVVNRDAYRGADGNATQIGHVPIVPGGKPCYCGNAGCLERYVSLRSLGEALGLTDPDLRSPRFAEQLKGGADPVLQAWCRVASGCLRDAVCIIENLLDTHTIVIGGSAPRFLVERLVGLAQPLHKSVRDGAASCDERILLSARGDDSCILGAAVLPVYERLSPRFEVLQQYRGVESGFERMLGRDKASCGAVFAEKRPEP